MPEQHPQAPRKLGWRWKRTALLLAGGAVANVAVAWGIAWRVADFQVVSVARAATAVDSEGWVVEVWLAARAEGFGSTRFVSVWNSDTRLPPSDVEGHPHPSRFLPTWQGFAELPPDENFRYAVLRGLPLHALVCFINFDEEDDPTYSMAINAGGSGQGSVERLLPLRPIWPGFIINTLFYALLLWLLFFAPFAARRMLRRRRGQCEKCAYPIGTWGGSPVCTECGAAVPRKVET